MVAALMDSFVNMDLGYGLQDQLSEEEKKRRKLMQDQMKQAGGGFFGGAARDLFGGFAGMFGGYGLGGR